MPPEAGVPNLVRHADPFGVAGALPQHLAALARAVSVRVCKQEAEGRDEDGQQQAHRCRAGVGIRSSAAKRLADAVADGPRGCPVQSYSGRPSVRRRES